MKQNNKALFQCTIGLGLNRCMQTRNVKNRCQTKRIEVGWGTKLYSQFALNSSNFTEKCMQYCNSHATTLHGHQAVTWKVHSFFFINVECIITGK